MFPLNGPFWSLLLEVLVNLLFAWVLVRLNRRGLLLVCGVAAAWLVRPTASRRCG